ncbi:hypothetical protein EV580_0091 [Mycobacterium sp. BK086]|nr:hypothetical protein EV580_0091 [Mycobacterium sp. BK086]
MTCHGHDHRYEFAWSDTDNGPVITDLRVISDAGTPITSRSLKRINAEVLARSAKRHDTDEAAETGRVMGLAAEIDLADVMSNPDPAARVAGVLAYFESDDSGFGADFADALRRESKSPNFSDLAERFDDWYGNRGESFVLTESVMRRASAKMLDDAIERLAGAPVKRRGGRPALTRAFLVKVANWARTAKDENRAVRQYVLDKANEGHPKPLWTSTDTAKKWIERCKEEGLLGDEELRKRPGSRSGQERR